MLRRRTSTALAALPCLLFLTACSGGTATGTSPTKPTGGEPSVSTEPVSQTTAITCGEQFRPPAPGPLTLTARFPATVARGPEPVTGSVAAAGTAAAGTAAAGTAAVHGVGPGRAEAFLVRDGGVVTLPVAQDSMGVVWDLAPGAVKTVPADLTLTSCEAGSAALAPGSYDLYVRVVLSTDDGQTESVGGPWPLQVQ